MNEQELAAIRARCDDPLIGGFLPELPREEMRALLAEVERLRQALDDARWALRNNPHGAGKAIALERIGEGLQ